MTVHIILPNISSQNVIYGNLNANILHMYAVKLMYIIAPFICRLYKFYHCCIEVLFNQKISFQTKNNYV